MKHFPVTKGVVLMRETGLIKAIDGISFSINQCETFGLVGESGCGKTTVLKLILLLEKITKGNIMFIGKDITKLSGADLKAYRGSVQAVFQDPYSSLSPRMRVKDIISEPLVLNNRTPRGAVRERVREVLELVGLSPEAAELYPHEFSGGQRQRIAIARALSLNAKLITLDEPVSSLDVSIRAQIMNLLRDLQSRVGLSYLLVAHDLAIVRYMSDRLGVMYLGKIVEVGDSEEIYQHPAHPYTRALLSAALPSHPDVKREEILLQGEIPSSLTPPQGCRFHTRCWLSLTICSEEEPQLKDVGHDHRAACHRC